MLCAYSGREKEGNRKGCRLCFIEVTSDHWLVCLRDLKNWLLFALVSLGMGTIFMIITSFFRFSNIFLWSISITGKFSFYLLFRICFWLVGRLLIVVERGREMNCDLGSVYEGFEPEIRIWEPHFIIFLSFWGSFSPIQRKGTR